MDVLFDIAPDPGLVVPKWTLAKQKVEWDAPCGPPVCPPSLLAVLPREETALLRWLVEVDDHWLHTGPVTRSGYCRVTPIDSRKFAWAHRYSHELFIGPIEPGNVVDHLCERKRCCAPHHLDQCTSEENVSRWHDRRRAERMASQGILL